MELPRHVQIGMLTYRVEVESQLTDATHCWGHIRHEPQTIFLNERNSDERMRIALWHEVKHAINELLGISDETIEEEATMRQAPMELMVLRDNPMLATYLLDESG